MSILALLGTVSLVICILLVLAYKRGRWNWTHWLLLGVSVTAFVSCIYLITGIKPRQPLSEIDSARADVEAGVEQAKLDLQAEKEVIAIWRNSQEPILVESADKLERQMLRNQQTIAEGEAYLRRIDYKPAKPDPWNFLHKH